MSSIGLPPPLNDAEPRPRTPRVIPPGTSDRDLYAFAVLCGLMFCVFVSACVGGAKALTKWGPK